MFACLKSTRVRGRRTKARAKKNADARLRAREAANDSEFHYSKCCNACTARCVFCVQGWSKKEETLFALIGCSPKEGLVKLAIVAQGMKMWTKWTVDHIFPCRINTVTLNSRSVVLIGQHSTLTERFLKKQEATSCRPRPWPPASSAGPGPTASPRTCSPTSTRAGARRCGCDNVNKSESPQK